MKRSFTSVDDQDHYFHFTFVLIGSFTTKIRSFIFEIPLLMYNLTVST